MLGLIQVSEKSAVFWDLQAKKKIVSHAAHVVVVKLWHDFVVAVKNKIPDVNPTGKETNQRNFKA